MLEKKMRKKYGAAVVFLLCASVLLQITVHAARQSLLQHGIAEEVLRFHVLANSDSEEDQSVKLLVRDGVLAWLKEHMEEAPGKQSRERDAEEAFRMGEEGRCRKDSGKTETETFLAEHLEEITAVADRILSSAHMPYRAAAALETSYFPDRTYGDCTFPAGWYQALRIRLGEAEGCNWWCVLYPRLCFTDCLHAVVEEDQLQQLGEVLTEEEYDSLLHDPKRWKLTFRWF